MVQRHDLSISEHNNEDQVAQEATALVDHGRWRLSTDGRELERTFKFRTFKVTWEFMNQVAEECKAQRHHPEWTNVFNRTAIKWTTHKPLGLSLKDTHMARFCDEVAAELGEQLEDGQGVEVKRVEGEGSVGDQK
ncbi:hypothetical protein LTR62_007671 [Meristemomyces frigidus]|uniref:4a-hydroxytetrahydrobiopterin dehydratase n=1 Tax=Meristemomyces frigidus TaxID=1508187 RepID=A0AAN7TEB9_9PEZI|nr:hypothetical protein LTR62_007671 [Meristemomyces frigidus]